MPILPRSTRGRLAAAFPGRATVRLPPGSTWRVSSPSTGITGSTFARPPVDRFWTILVSSTQFLRHVPSLSPRRSAPFTHPMGPWSRLRFPDEREGIGRSSTRVDSASSKVGPFGPTPGSHFHKLSPGASTPEAPRRIQPGRDPQSKATDRSRIASSTPWQSWR